MSKKGVYVRNSKITYNYIKFGSTKVFGAIKKIKLKKCVYVKKLIPYIPPGTKIFFQQLKGFDEIHITNEEWAEKEVEDVNSDIKE